MRKLDKKRLEFLTKRKINFIGNLKLSSMEKANNNKELKFLHKKFFRKKIIMFASTHEGEEKKFIKIIKRLSTKYKKLKIIIAPRHPKRVNSIINIVNDI